MSAALLDAVVRRHGRVAELRARLEPLWQMQRVLEQVRHHQLEFDMTDWGAPEESWLPITSCGTVHCLGGWLALDPWFRVRGLALLPTEDGSGSIFLLDPRTGCFSHLSVGPNMSQHALQHVCRLNPREAYLMFFSWAAREDLEAKRRQVRDMVWLLEHELEWLEGAA